MDLEMLKERARIIRQVRSFFDDRGYLELDTPLLSPDLIPESCLEVFETYKITPNGGVKGAASKAPLWLIPSPEIWMKKIIAQHKTNVYQICKCFRNGESSGFLHNPEFTMLEYYTMNANYLNSLKLTEDLCAFLAKNAQIPAFSQPVYRMTVAEAFSRFAGVDLFAASDMEAEARRLGLDPMPGLGTAALYDLIFIHAVEPQLKLGMPVALLDYPAFVPCLAKRNADGKTVQRWELYYNGIELANCYTEETDAENVRNFFNSEEAEKAHTALVKHKVDDNFWKLFSNNKFPACSGVALGLDRLIMALCNRSSIDSVLPFPMK